MAWLKGGKSKVIDLLLRIVSFLKENKVEFNSIDTLSREKTEPQQ